MFLFRKKSKMLPVNEMLRGERWVSEQSDKGINLSEDLLQVCKELKLKVEKCQLPDDQEATLKPIDDPEFLGLIEVNEKVDLTRDQFSIMHEIVHYLHDVGIGKPVTKVFERKVHGSPKTEEEQYIDYLAAAIRMPLKNVLEDIDEYNKNSADIDELTFIAEKGKKYGENIERALDSAYFRRIREASVLRNSSEIRSETRVSTGKQQSQWEKVLTPILMIRDLLVQTVNSIIERVKY